MLMCIQNNSFKGIMVNKMHRFRVNNKKVIGGRKQTRKSRKRICEESNMRKVENETKGLLA